MTVTSEVISLYKQFDKYKKLTYKQLECHIQKSIELNQYKIHEKNGKIVAFTNWAFMNEKHEEHFKKTGQVLFNFWDSGEKCWIIDSLCHDENFDAVYEWAKKYFTQQLGIGVPVSWLSVNGIADTHVHTKLTKEDYLDG